MTSADLYHEIFTPMRIAAADRPYVIGQLGQSLDGRVATLSGDANNVSGPAGMDHLHHLRAYCDVVVIGAGTAQADDPQLTVRRVKGNNPARAVIDPQRRLKGSYRWQAQDGTPSILITAQETAQETAQCGTPNGNRTILLPKKNGKIAPQDIISGLFSQNLRVILVEGGPATLANFLEADCVDRLHVCVSPLIIGSGKAGLDLPPIQTLAQARRPSTRTFAFTGGEVLFDCDLRGSS